MTVAAARAGSRKGPRQIRDGPGIDRIVRVNVACRTADERRRGRDDDHQLDEREPLLQLPHGRPPGRKQVGNLHSKSRATNSSKENPSVPPLASAAGCQRVTRIAAYFIYEPQAVYRTHDDPAASGKIRATTAMCRSSWPRRTSG